MMERTPAFDVARLARPLWRGLMGCAGQLPPNGRAMICLDILVNGAKLCTAGVGEPGNAHAHIIWVLRRGPFDYGGTPGTDDETVSLTVDGEAYARQEFLSWPDTNLKVGDEVTIRVVERETADEPARLKMDEQMMRRILEPRRALYERLKREFEGSPETD